MTKAPGVLLGIWAPPAPTWTLFFFASISGLTCLLFWLFSYHCILTVLVTVSVTHPLSDTCLANVFFPPVRVTRLPCLLTVSFTEQKLLVLMKSGCQSCFTESTWSEDIYKGIAKPKVGTILSPVIISFVVLHLLGLWSILNVCDECKVSIQDSLIYKCCPLLRSCLWKTLSLFLMEGK